MIQKRFNIFATLYHLRQEVKTNWSGERKHSHNNQENMASSSSTSQNTADEDIDPEFESLATVPVVGDKKSCKGGNKPLWKKLFPFGPKKEKNLQDEEFQQQMEITERQCLLSTSDQGKRKGKTATTENSDTKVGSHKNYQSISNVSYSQHVTPEPVLKRSRQTGPLQIAWPVNNATSLTISVKPICRLLAQPEIASLPVAIFSINGITRGGKSFLLNQAVKFLKFGKSHPNDWIDQHVEMRFDWSFRMESVTEGIQVWPEPFILEEADKKLVLILIDNQGLADVHTMTHVAYKLFCLSNLLSSVFTYCDTQAYTKNYLESLHTFMEFSKSVEHDGRSTDELDENLAYTFGKLILLFRDFRFVNEFPCEQGCSFYDKNISSQKNNNENLYAHIFNTNVDNNVSKVVQDKRSALLQFYDDILISTIIGPGNREPNNTDRLHSSTWDPDFKNGVVKFVESIFSYQFMSQATKKISGHEITSETLIRYVENWAKIISERDYSISDITGLEASRDLYYNLKIEESFRLYRSSMDRYKISPAVGTTDICKVLVDTIKSIESRFWRNCEYGDWRGFYMKKMQTKISEYSNEQSLYLHFVIGKKRKRKKMIVAAVAVGGTLLSLVGVVGGVFLVASGIGAIITMGAGGVFVYCLWKDMKEKNAVKKISSRVDSAFGINSHFNFKERLRLMKTRSEPINRTRFLMIFKHCFK